MTGETKRICVWSGPRNISTALMYSFAQRADTRAVDEPLYGHYLAVSGAEHPGGGEVRDQLDPDGERALRDVVLGPCDRPVLFLKQMAHHLVGDLDWGFMERTVNVLLARDPEQMLPSLNVQVPGPDMRDAGYDKLERILDHCEGLGQQVPVLDSRDLQNDPEGVLRRLLRAHWHFLGPGDVELARGPEALRRLVGAVLVPQRPQVDWLHALQGEDCAFS